MGTGVAVTARAASSDDNDAPLQFARPRGAVNGVKVVLPGL
jgi:hypothetical protein